MWTDREFALCENLSKAIFLQNIVKNLERQEVRDWLQNTREILEGEKKVHNIITTHTRTKVMMHMRSGRCWIETPQQCD